MPFNRVPRPILSIAVGTKAFSFRHYPVQRVQSRWYIQQLSNEAIWAHLQWNNYTKWNMAHIILAACHSLRNMTRTFSVLDNDSVTPYRGNQSEKTCSWSGAKTDDSRRAKKKNFRRLWATCYGLLRVSVTFSFIKYRFPSILVKTQWHSSLPRKWLKPFWKSPEQEHSWRNLYAKQ